MVLPRGALHSHNGYDKPRPGCAAASEPAGTFASHPKGATSAPREYSLEPPLGQRLHRHRGEYVGLKRIDDAIWNVYFDPLKPGRLLERQMRIEDAYG